ncbi:amidase [Burkholderia lata]|uniref:Amidase n=1 Tax=Burkholderia lata (strain ATCC 17760 / DSM 23089 / LMG 22485 / NCIMB 9086 / R18194 / 383) TaxID=482957 RepID=A0A6P2XBA0_BURL3|nr:amidase [Burkholderia lata]
MGVMNADDASESRATCLCHDLMSLSAVQIAAYVRRRELSPVEVVSAHIEHAKCADASINAIAHERFRAALEEARHAERMVMRGEILGPLHGVPCTVKEGLGFGGLPHTAGSTLRRTHRAKSDATVVARIRAAGAVVIGLTNQSEMALWPAASNLVYGRTENPWCIGRSAGGSSGGEAAIVAAGGAVFGIGTDGGGSIRIPAAYCGVFGHKPSSRTAPLTGHVPLDEMFGMLPGAQDMARYFAPGPMARRAEDLMVVLRVMAGEDGFDRNVKSCTLLEPVIARLKGRRVLMCDAPPIGRRSVHVEAGAAVRRAAVALESVGAIVVPWSDPLLANAFELWATAVSACEGPSMQELIGQGRPPSLGRELGRRLIGKPRHTVAAWVTCASERWWSPRPAVQLRRVQEFGALSRHLLKSLGDDGLLLLPPVSGVAPRHGDALLHPADIGLSALFNIMELPATVVPVGSGAHGLPLSVQVVGPYGGDHLTLSAALALEHLLGGWLRPAI